MTDSKTTLADCKALVQQFVEARNWTESHSGKNLAMSIAIEAAELMEHFQWGDRRDYRPENIPQEEFAKIREEVADILIYCLSFCNTYQIDAAAAIEDKVAKNERRFPVPRP